MLVELSGIFTKIAFAEDVDNFLLRGSPTRPAGRFNSPGQDALYLSNNEESARAALIKYIKDDDPPRVLIEYEIEKCWVVDLGHPDVIDWFTASREDWQEAASKGGIPKSWEMADSIRKTNHVGLIDPSRRVSDLWHITLFRWNVVGGPTVEQRGLPVPVNMDLPV